MKILIVKTSSLGDILQSFPALAFIKETKPEAEIHWIVEKGYSSMVQAHPLIDHVFSVDTKKWRKPSNWRATWKEIREFRREIKKIRYDAVIDLQGNTKSGLIVYQTIAKRKIGFGSKTVPEKLNLLFSTRQVDPPKGKNIREDYLYLAEAAIGEPLKVPGRKHLLTITAEESDQIDGLLCSSRQGNAQNILVCPGSAWENKRISPDTLIQFLQKAAEHLPCAFYFLSGNEQEEIKCTHMARNFPESVVLPRLSLPVLQNLMDRMDVVVSMDSLPLHLAAETRVKTLALFGPSLSDKYNPIGSRHAFIQGKCPYGEVFEKRCRKLRTCKTGACIKNISSEDIFSLSTELFVSESESVSD